MAAVNGNEYDHVDFTKNGITTRHLLKDTNARKEIDDLVTEVDSLNNDVSYLSKSIEMLFVPNQTELQSSFGKYGYINYRTGEAVNLSPAMNGGYDTLAYTSKVFVAGLSKIFYKNIEFVETPYIEQIDPAYPDEISLEYIYNTGMAFYTKDDVYIRGRSTIINSDNEYDRYKPDLEEVSVPRNAAYAMFTVFTDTSTYGNFSVQGLSLGGELLRRIEVLEEAISDLDTTSIEGHSLIFN